jgi:hypothetical protein
MPEQIHSQFPIPQKIIDGHGYGSGCQSRYIPNSQFPRKTIDGHGYGFGCQIMDIYNSIQTKERLDFVNGITRQFYRKIYEDCYDRK